MKARLKKKKLRRLKKEKEVFKMSGKLLSLSPLNHGVLGGTGLGNPGCSSIGLAVIVL